MSKIKMITVKPLGPYFAIDVDGSRVDVPVDVKKIPSFKVPDSPFWRKRVASGDLEMVVKSIPKKEEDETEKEEIKDEK